MPIEGQSGSGRVSTTTQPREARHHVRWEPSRYDRGARKQSRADLDGGADGPLRREPRARCLSRDDVSRAVDRFRPRRRRPGSVLADLQLIAARARAFQSTIAANVGAAIATVMTTASNRPRRWGTL